MGTLCNGTQQITTALLLAAGTGSRLQPLTHDAPKCLTEVNGTTILERLVCSLRAAGFRRLIVVVGYLDSCIREVLASSARGLAIEFVSSPKYRTTNNIYSLWEARNAIREPFLLVESDLIFDTVLLEDMRAPDRIAISRILPWMNGTTVALAFSPSRSIGSGSSHLQDSEHVQLFVVFVAASHRSLGPTHFGGQSRPVLRDGSRGIGCRR